MLRKLRVSRQHGESVERQTIAPDENCSVVAYGILGMCSAVLADMLMRWDPLGGQKISRNGRVLRVWYQQRHIDGLSIPPRPSELIFKMFKTFTR